MNKFNKAEGEHEVRVMNLTHKFAMKMAVMICISAVSIVSILGIFFGVRTPLALGVLAALAGLVAIVSFSVTRSAIV